MVRLLCCFFKHMTAYEMRISDWSSDVCSSDLRVRAVLRRTGNEKSASAKLEFADLELDDDTHEVWRGSARIELTPTEYKLLRYMRLNARRALWKAQILD